MFSYEYVRSKKATELSYQFRLPQEVPALINSSVVSQFDASPSLLLNPNGFRWFLQGWTGLDSRYLMQIWLPFV